MKRKKFHWLINRLGEQKEKERKDLEKRGTPAKQSPKGKMKYLGNIRKK